MCKKNKGGNNMALTGFNPEAVNESVRKVNTAYNELMNTLYNGVQKNFLDALAERWACEQAVSFFNEAVATMNNLCYAGGDSVNVIFQSVADSMNSAANAWAVETNSAYTPVPFNAFESRFNANSARTEINGVQGIDLEEAQQVAKSLETTSASIMSALDSAKAAVIESGFVGGGQEEALNSSLEQIKANVSNAFETISANAQNAIAATVNSYGNTSGAVRAAFLGN